jgi:hypothetical protein
MKDTTNIQAVPIQNMCWKRLCGTLAVVTSETRDMKQNAALAMPTLARSPLNAAPRVVSAA